MERKLFRMNARQKRMRSTDDSGYIHIQTAISTLYPIFMILFHRLRIWEGIVGKGEYMARTKKTEGGQGGKRGHSNMVHHAKTADIKEAANRLRREQAKLVVQSDIATMLDSKKRPPDAGH